MLVCGTHLYDTMQFEYSIISRDIERSILPALRELGIGVTAYGVLSRGLLSGSKPTGRNDFRATLPRFSGANYDRNAAFLNAFNAIAWVLARGNDVVPLICARKRAQLTEALAALNIKLSDNELARIGEAVPSDQISGARYDEHQMQMLDSEK
jgi:aryl-alcohol dehydrogenase-like predicted oxidoreductase